MKLGERVAVVHDILRRLSPLDTPVGSLEWFRQCLAEQGVEVSQPTMSRWASKSVPDHARVTVEETLEIHADRAEVLLQFELTKLRRAR